MTRTLRQHVFGNILYSVMMLAITGRAIAQPSSVDWKFYGGTSSDSCFYDANGIMHLPGDHVRVWAKCLRQSDLDHVDIKNDFKGKILENTAQKIAQYYIPPIASLESLNTDQSMAVTQYEVTATIGNLEPQAKILYELDCRERRNRELSISIRSNGKSSFQENPSQWHFVPPESNGSRLLKLLCTP